jgi:hypothetical protein
MDFNPNLVNIYIEASSKENLVKLQIMTNNINGKAYNYQTPSKDGKKWVVWFFANWQNHIYTSEKDLNKMLPEGKSLTEMTQESN